ncbi:MAG: hypothetical protein MJZ37_08440 [Bacilli bacterium]|nr:hypothetical protein [Bacilli bacterium]
MENTNNNQENANEIKEAFTVSEVNKDAYAILPAGEGATIRETSTPEVKVLFNAVNGGSTPCVDLAETGATIDVMHIVVTSADVLKEIDDDPETGERESKACCHFFTVDGKHYSSVSNGIIKSVSNLFACGLIPTEESPLKLRFKTQKTRRGTAHTFDLA